MSSPSKLHARHPRWRFASCSSEEELNKIRDHPRVRSEDQAPWKSQSPHRPATQQVRKEDRRGVPLVLPQLRQRLQLLLQPRLQPRSRLTGRQHPRPLPEDQASPPSRHRRPRLAEDEGAEETHNLTLLRLPLHRQRHSTGRLHRQLLVRDPLSLACRLPMTSWPTSWLTYRDKRSSKRMPDVAYPFR